MTGHVVVGSDTQFRIRAPDNELPADADRWTVSCHTDVLR
jgi:hypothetical protein